MGLCLPAALFSLLTQEEGSPVKGLSFKDNLTLISLIPFLAAILCSQIHLDPSADAESHGQHRLHY